MYAVATVQEEIGLRGAHTSAYGIDPQVGIAVDVTHATDCPTIDKTQNGDIKLGGGPVIARGPNMNPIVVERLRTAAEAADIVVQWEAIGRGTGTDANAIQLARAGVAAGLVSIPNRYMHSAVEMMLARRPRPAPPICWRRLSPSSKRTPTSRRSELVMHDSPPSQ